MGRRRKDTLELPKSAIEEYEDFEGCYDDEYETEYSDSGYDVEPESDYYDTPDAYGDGAYFDESNYDSEDIRENAMKYIDSDPYVKSVYGDTDYEEDREINDGVGSRKKKKAQKRSDRVKKKHNDKPRKKKKHKKKHLLLKTIIACAVIAGLVVFMMSDFFNIEKIEVSGNSVYASEEIVKDSGIKVGQNIFKINKWAGKKAIRKKPYVESVKIKRSLPTTIKIQLVERSEMAYVESNNKFYVIDITGHLLRVGDAAPQLTQITGVKIGKSNLGEQLNVKNLEGYDKALDMLNAMNEGGLFFKKLEVTKDDLKVYVYDELIIKGSSEDIIKSIEKGQLQLVLSDIVAKDIRTGSIIIGEEDYCSYSPNI